jgi:hypothetical protein
VKGKVPREQRKTFASSKALSLFILMGTRHDLEYLTLRPVETEEYSLEG